MEEKLGRNLLPDEQVHHKDKNPLNNDPDNLEIELFREHQRLHNPSKYKDTIIACCWCGKEFEFAAKKQRNHAGNRAYGPFCSRKCSGEYGAAIQNKNQESTRRKLSEDDVRFIREHYKPYDKEFGMPGLANKFGVGKSVIDYVIRRKTYKNVE